MNMVKILPFLILFKIVKVVMKFLKTVLKQEFVVCMLLPFDKNRVKHRVN